MTVSQDRAPQDEGEPKGDMGAADGVHEYFVVNVTTGPLDGKVQWEGGGGTRELDVSGLQPGKTSALKDFDPQSGSKDWWKWDQRGRWYQLNCYGGDRYVAVVITNYGISVIPTATSPDSWKW
ncbi:hypothetical protein ACIGXI_09780 [Kitasatospora aureofaciens]|uniref:hypothetical protein n=1 Tax=Kitasatospora aureofaciens TaxID=1894 RepID=UPI0037CA8860